MPARYVLWPYRQQLLAGLDSTALAAIGRGAFEADDCAGQQRAIDAMAIALVARAVLGDARAAAEIFVQIEGRAGRRRPDASFDPPLMDLEPIVRLLRSSVQTTGPKARQERKTEGHADAACRE